MARKQKELAGMETATAIPEVDAAAERLKSASKKRKAAQDTEVEAKELLLRLMEDNKLQIYEDHDCNPPLVVTLGVKKTVTVEELGKAPEAEPDDLPSPASLKKLEGRASKKSSTPAPVEA